MPARGRIYLSTKAATVALVMAAAFVACAPGALASGTDVRALSIPTSFPTVTYSIPPSFSIEPAALDFGDVPAGTQKTLSVTLTNNGTDADYFGLDPGPPTSLAYMFEEQQPCMEKIFYSGRSCFLFYTFWPQSAGAVDITSTLTISARNLPKPIKLTVTLAGCGTDPGKRCPPTATTTPRPTNPRPTNPAELGFPPGGADAAGATDAPGVGPSASAPQDGTGTLRPDSASVSRSGPSIALAVLALVTSAVVGAAIAALVAWRGRRIWSTLTRSSHRG